VADVPTLVVVGAATRDIDAADPRGWRLGGGVTYAAMTAARLGLDVRALIGVDAVAAEAAEIDVLRKSGARVRLVELANGPVFDNRETPLGRVQYAVAASDPLPARDLPDDWRAAPHVLLTPVAAELGPDWATAFDQSAFVALAAQGVMRVMRPGEEVLRLPVPDATDPLTRRSDLIALSGEDAVAGAPPIRDLLSAGQALLVTGGDKGALEIRRTDTGITGCYMPPLPRRAAVDTTGAGDTFLAAYVAGRALAGDSWRPLAVASAMGSLAVTRRTLDATPTKSDLCAALIVLRNQRLG